MALAPADPIRCATLVVAGEVEAIVECTGCVTIAGTGVFRGSIRAPAMIVEDGAIMEADVAVGSDLVRPANAA
jgi:cytoskeletal protein CcmA (bactofilin family)